MTTITGYKKDQQGIWISKDPNARLTYTFDWSQWLAQGQTVVSATYTQNSRANDTAPLVIITSGITDLGTKTFVKVSGGAVGKIYTVTVSITTDDGSIDRRSFRLKIENRSA